MKKVYHELPRDNGPGSAREALRSICSDATGLVWDADAGAGFDLSVLENIKKNIKILESKIQHWEVKN